MLASRLLSNPTRCAVTTSRAMAHTDILCPNYSGLSKVEVKLDKIPPGKKADINWRGRPLFVVYRTQAGIHTCKSANWAELRDPIDEVLKGLGDRGIERNGQEVSFQDMFKLFQLENKFLINEDKLHREMVKLQRALHPDKYLRASATSKVVSDKLSSIVNGAFETLKNPYRRALYLIAFKTGKTDVEIEKRLDNLKLDPGFLSKMMDIRERIDLDKDGLPEKMKLAIELQTDLDALILKTNRDFEIEDYDSVIEKLGYMKFLANCHAAIKCSPSCDF